MNKRKTLLLVDDEAINLQVLQGILGSEYRLLFAKNGQRALDLSRSESPDLVLLDVMMPEMSGHEVCQMLKQDLATRNIPVIFVTALSDTDDEAQGFALGAVDYITKPVSPPIVLARVKTHLALVNYEELRATRLSIVQRLGRAAEYKDNETGLHVIRMSHFARLIALAAGYSREWADNLLNTAPMHDVGKIGIPDAILQHPGALDAAQWEVMRQHTLIGAEIIGDDGSAFLRMAREIALNHHEKWNGSGYPHGIAGEAIPVSARIVAIADVFDALTSRRPYKEPWSVSEALELIRRERGEHFDPELVDAFERCLPEILAVRERWQEDDDVLGYTSGVLAG
ncbi:MAG: two-component system response regulator [Haliea sp.]|nr:two-component system response regulator [Haliea sp.]|tara:strand:- start:83358 stop:84380 length:1023 start_codon:yes stop_codon:yes gene_type:complete